MAGLVPVSLLCNSISCGALLSLSVLVHEMGTQYASVLASWWGSDKHAPHRHTHVDVPAQGGHSLAGGSY